MKTAASIQALLEGIHPIGEANIGMGMLVQGTVIFRAEIQVLVGEGLHGTTGIPTVVVQTELLHSDLRPKGSGFVNFMKAGIARRGHRVVIGTLD